MPTSIFCIAPSIAVADRVITGLKSLGFGDTDISVLLPDKSGARDIEQEKHTKAAQGVATGAGVGGLVGGTAGLLAGVGLLAIPGMGPLVGAGPIISSLSVLAMGATLGGVAGAIFGLGIPELEARQYEGKVNDGNTLIVVHAQTSAEIHMAKEVFEAEGATDILSAGENATEAKPAVTVRPTRDASQTRLN